VKHLKAIVLYSSVDGQTQKISQHIGRCLEQQFQVEIQPITMAVDKLESYDLIIIGASIRYGHHRQLLYQFIEKHLALLSTKPNAFFSVNIVARKPDKNTPETNPYVIKFLEKTTWRPNKLAVFAGRLNYPKYRFFDKYIILFIMWLGRGPTDISRVHELTDWNQVDRFAKALLKVAVNE